MIIDQFFITLLFLRKMLVRALVAVLALVFVRTHAKQRDFYSFKVVNSRGKLVSLEKYRGSVSVRPDLGSSTGSGLYFALTFTNNLKNYEP